MSLCTSLRKGHFSRPAGPAGIYLNSLVLLILFPKAILLQQHRVSIYHSQKSFLRFPLEKKLSFVDKQSSSYWSVTKPFWIPKIKLWVTQWSNRCRMYNHSARGYISGVYFSLYSTKSVKQALVPGMRSPQRTDLSKHLLNLLYFYCKDTIYLLFYLFHLFPFEVSELAMWNNTFTTKWLYKNIIKYKLQIKLINLLYSIRLVHWNNFDLKRQMS